MEYVSKHSDALGDAEPVLEVSNTNKDDGKDVKSAPKRPKKKKSKKSRARSSSASKVNEKRSALRRPYPRVALEEALRVPFAIKDKNGGNPWPPTDVATALNLSHKTPAFFYVAAASRDFGFTEGSRDSEEISLTDFGRDVVYAPTRSRNKQNYGRRCSGSKFLARC